MLRWGIAQAGLFLTVFAAVALSGPGRIDIVDGQTRYEVARSIVDHGDLIIRDPNVWFVVFPGRDGQRYTKYRFAQSAVGIAAILIADATGPVQEARRHFFFTLTSGFASAVLAVTYAALFRSFHHRSRIALLWAVAGIFCTPSWFYGTSTFDDILGSTAVVVAVSIVLAQGKLRPRLGGITAGLALGIAFNCKEPLGLFVLPVAGVICSPRLDWRSQWLPLLLMVLLLGAGMVFYKGHDLYKFPPASTVNHAELMKRYGPIWSEKPEIALSAMLFSFGTGVFYYSPTIIICLVGVFGWWNRDRLFCQLLLLAIGVYVIFISSLTFFKGDPAWGPRYLTPTFAVLWIFAPMGACLLRKWVVVTLLGLGALVQLGALCVDPHRLYIEQCLPSAFYVAHPTLYFNPVISHLANRPREIVEALSGQGRRANYYSPSPMPTFAFPIIDEVEKGPVAIQKYHVLKGFRFWWASFPYLSPLVRPIHVSRTALLLGMLMTVGVILQLWATHCPRSLKLSLSGVLSLVRSRFSSDSMTDILC